MMSHVNPDSSNSSTDGPLSTTTDRIAIHPGDFPLELFETEQTLVSRLQKDRIDQSLQKVDELDLDDKRLALETEIFWHLKQATRHTHYAPQLVEKAHHVLERWHEKAQDSEFPYPIPSWYAHESVVLGWKRIGMSTDDYAIQAAKRADKVLRLLLNRIDRKEVKVHGSLDRLYTLVIRLWLKAPYSLDRSELSLKLECVSRASELLQDQERRSDANDENFSNRRPQKIAFSKVLQLFNNLSTTARKMSTDTDDWYITLAETAARKSEELLTWMEKRHEIPGIDFPPPDVYEYRNVLSSWASIHSRESVEKAKIILLRMEKAQHLRQGDCALYRRVMLHVYSIMSPLEDYQAADAASPANKAVSLLARIDPMLETLIQRDIGHDVSSNGDLLIHDRESQDYVGEIMCYDAVIQALANAKVSEETAVSEMPATPATLAEIILYRVEELKALGKLNKPPNIHVYGNVIRAFIQWSSRSTDKSLLAAKVERVLNLIETKVSKQEEISAETQREIIAWYTESIPLVSEPTFGGSPCRAAELKQKMEILRNEMSKKGTS